MAETNNPKATSWRKKYRQHLLSIACIGFLAGFYSAYRGGVSDNSPWIFASFAIFTFSSALSILVKK